MPRGLTTRLRAEQGSSLVEGLLALSLVTLAFAVGVELLLVVQARAVALAAAAEGARAAALSGPQAGLAAADELLRAGGGLANGLSATIVEQGATVTATVAGAAPAPFGLRILLPAIRRSATLPLERYPAAEAATSR